MSVTALVLFAVYLLIAFVVRTWLQLRRTGDSGWRGISGRPGTPEWWAGILFAIALVAGVLGPVTALLGLNPLDAITATAVQVTGTVLAVAGVLATFLTQVAMGANWRIGVDETERTDLVTTGPFALVRNPIFTAMAFTGLGLALMVPNVVALTGFVLLLVALHLQVRVVEEPYLRQAHGDIYAQYAASTGRFLPRLGRLPASANGVQEAA
jgi:protein-S-isoprenylcysteine O-methyltransferase Ste14